MPAPAIAASAGLMEGFGPSVPPGSRHDLPVVYSESAQWLHESASWSWKQDRPSLSFRSRYGVDPAGPGAGRSGLREPHLQATSRERGEGLCPKMTT